MLNQLTWILHELFKILRRRYQPMQLCLWAGFSSPAQASFFFLCTGDSASTGYRPCVMPRPGTTNENFQQSGKQDSFRNILKSSARIYESSGWQFFRTTTGIQSGPDAFDESRFAMTFLTWGQNKGRKLEITGKVY